MRLTTRLAVGLIRGYQRLLSPLLGNNCRYEPSCSQYGIEAIEHYGVLRGVPMTVWRILRCNPLAKGGFDPPYPSATTASEPDAAIHAPPQAPR